MLLSKDVNQQIRCCFSNDGHICNDAVLITECLGNCCTECIQNCKEASVKCFNCKKEHKIEELKKFPKNPAIKIMINFLISDLFKELNEKLKNTAEFLTENSIKTELQKQFDTIENQLEIRIESLVAQLHQYREEVMEKIIKNKDDFFESLKLHQNLQSIRKEFEMNPRESYEDLFKLQKSFRESQILLQEIKRQINEMKFTVDEEECISKTTIGSLNLINLPLKTCTYCTVLNHIDTKNCICCDRLFYQFSSDQNCKNCNARILEEFIFCDECGIKLKP